MKFFSFILLCLLSVISCLNNEESISDPVEDWVQVSPTTFGFTDQQGGSITISMTQNCGSACWIEFDDQVSRSGNTFNITTSALRGSEICTEQCVPYTRTYDIDLTTAGEYTFRYIVADTVASEFSYTLN